MRIEPQSAVTGIGEGESVMAYHKISELPLPADLRDFLLQAQTRGLELCQGVKLDASALTVIALAEIVLEIQNKNKNAKPKPTSS